MIECSRCGRSKPPMERPPYPGPMGERVLAQVCSECWNEWREMEVRVINELRLNFLEPEAQETLAKQQCEFLGLPMASEPDDG